MSKNLIRFSLFSVVWAIIYFFVMLYATVGEDPTKITSIALLFTVALTTAEGYFLHRDDQRATRSNLRLSYTLIAIVASALGAGAWALSLNVNAIWFILAEIITIAVLGIFAIIDSRRK